ncbi:sulfotransferase [Congregibacter variabilis]|uniref:Sulfotransferase n=1 Tax=Congregibacter variabilis TaxID=3081200 RepID=A0ABZ0I1V6_9GAMM|nr:sulfotransferase [Congregibacter sp. IMCC43200]
MSESERPASSPGATSPGATEAPVSIQAQELMRKGKISDALKLLQTQLQRDPEHSDALYFAAVCARMSRSFASAQEYLHKLLAMEPGNGRALQEQAHLYRDTGDATAAIDAYGEALRANPALVASYRQRLALLRSTGREPEARITAAQLHRVEELPKPLLAVTDLLAQGRILKAEQLCRQFLMQSPQHTEGMRLLAEIGSRLGALEEANFLLESACELKPGDIALRIDLIRVLSKRQRFEESLKQADLLLQSAPENLQFQSLRAIELLQLGHYDEAIEGFDRILEKLPGDAITLTSKGHALKTLGSGTKAIVSYEAACMAPQGGGEAWYALANLKTYSFSDAQIETMGAQLAGNPQLLDRIYLAFALGKAFEDRKEYERSFEHYAAANSLKKAQLNYRSESFEREVDAQCATVSSELVRAQTGLGFEAADPIFIVGMPRAGSTLLEQILATHSQVDGTRELPNILSLAQRLRRQRNKDGDGVGYPDILADLSAESLQQLGKDFIQETRVHRGDAPFFIDKMPNNFRHIGLIKLILPEAKIIDARREAMACCFSNFKQLFAEGQEFSYELSDLGHYYRQYERLMDHWNSVLPGSIHRLQHEALLEDFEGELRRLLDFLGLPFEERCLRFYENDRPVRTPSSEQVRQPLFRDSVEQWQNYAPWLSPLQRALDYQAQ